MHEFCLKLENSIMVFPVLVSHTVKKLMFVRILVCLVVNYIPEWFVDILLHIGIKCYLFTHIWREENEWKYYKFKKTQVAATRPSERLWYQVVMWLVLCAKVGGLSSKILVCIIFLQCVPMLMIDGAFRVALG